MIAEEELEALQERLAAAEKVCRLLAVNPARWGTPREKALLQSWMDWSERYSSVAPGVSEEEIERLALVRDTRRAEALRALMGGEA